MFDTFLTLPSEIRYIWCEQRRLGSVLYILARYPTLAFVLTSLYVDLFVSSIQVCEYTASHMRPVLTTLHI